MGKKWKKKTPILPRVLAGSAVLYLAFNYFRRPATEAILVRGFYRNLPDFMELESMLATNTPMDPALPPVGSTEPPIWSQEDYRRYRTLLRRVGVIRVLQTGSEVRFQLAGAPGSAQRERTGVMWTESQPDCLVASLTEFRKGRAQLDHAYRPLTNGWYLWISK
jgi:hypothetical protein